MFRIIYFRKKCIGCNACVEAAPGRWRMSRKDGKSTLINGKDKNGIFTTLADPDEYELNAAAAVNCPVKIIRLELLE